MRSVLGVLRASPRPLRLSLLVAGLALVAVPAFAGGGVFGDDEMEENAGHPFVGYVRDADGNGVPDAKITVDLKNGTVVLRTDGDGHFFVRGFGKNVDPDDVKVSCSKEGYTQSAVSKQAQSDDPKAPVEVNCILQSGK